MKRLLLFTFFNFCIFTFHLCTAQVINMHVNLKDGSVAKFNTDDIDFVTFVEDGSGNTQNEPEEPTVTGDATDIYNNSATVTAWANGIQDNLATDLSVGVIYSTDPTPNQSNSQKATVSHSDVSADGKYTVTITGLAPSTTYYYRSFVYQSGIYRYGAVKSFTTTGFTTGEVSDITCFSAKASAAFHLNYNPSISYSSLSCGICYGLEPNPTIDKDQKVEAVNYDGNGSFTVTLRALRGNATYYYRPFAKIDGSVYYGATATFQTLPDDVVETGDWDTETRTVTSRLTLGGGAYSELKLGVCWGTTEQPTVENSQYVTTNETDENGYFSVVIWDYGTIYYCAVVWIDGVAHYGSVKLIHFPIETTTFTANGASFTMVKVDGGTFQMGQTDVATPVHTVTLSDYYIGQTEVTQALWTAVMGSNPSRFQGDNRPVEQVSWNDCQTFITKLNALTGQTFRLPTEAEWEFAARGGNASKGYTYSGSNTLGDVAWYDDNSYSLGSSHPDYGTHAVATKSPNELGIYDMSGNVLEWCQDWYGSYSSESQTNPTGPTSGPYREIRGGSWGSSDSGCRVARRGGNTPASTSDNLGLRLAF